MIDNDLNLYDKGARPYTVPTEASIQKLCDESQGVYFGTFEWPLRPEDEPRYKAIKTPPGMLFTASLTKGRVFVYALPQKPKDEELRQTVFFTDAVPLTDIEYAEKAS